MKYALVADDGQARVVVAESDIAHFLSEDARQFSSVGIGVNPTCKWHVCEREPSANGHHLVAIETWEKGVRL